MTMPAEDAGARHSQPVTVSHVFGEIVWLLSQSRHHTHLTVHDMNWLVMPAVQLRQFHIFREGERPVGVVLWALLDEPAEQKVMRGLRDGSKLEESDWTAGDRLWLVEFVAPFANQENRQAEVMMADLVTGRFANRAFSLMRTDPANGDVKMLSVPADTGSKLAQKTQENLGEYLSCL
jgi:cytolysin-activating lysine-acyltransferase